MTNLETVRARFARNRGLPFADVLTEAMILDVLNDYGVKYRDRIQPGHNYLGLPLASA